MESDLRIKSAVDCLKSGGIIAIPTDTVYGLGADPFNADAVQKLYTLKGRPEEKPIPLVLGTVEDVQQVAQNLPDFFFHLTDKFWPGGLTIIVESKNLLPQLTAGGTTVGLRIPNQPLLLDILQEFGGPLAITSANLSGQPAATSPREFGKELSSKIDFIVDDGQTPGPIPSTVYDISVFPPQVRREGVISSETLAKELMCYNRLSNNS
ncbi:MAG: L-threonylcarbamoyladenylate synthase [Candidatus Poribacteria bacterium]|nr:L-threonylcarbamoyladenylate synthase [Candidatus Poribacteria bacterium]